MKVVVTGAAVLGLAAPLLLQAQEAGDMNHQDLLQRFIEAVQREDTDAYGQFFAEDAVAHYPLSPAPLEGRAAIQQAEQALFDSFSDVSIEVVRLFGDDRGVAAEVLLSATNDGDFDLGNGQIMPATGRSVELPAVWVFELNADGLIAAERDYFDTVAFMSQLGLMEGHE